MRDYYVVTIRNYDGAVVEQKTTYSTFDDAFNLAIGLRDALDADDFDIETTDGEVML